MNRNELKQLAILFLKLGTIAFGGPAAHIAMMRREVVERRSWMSESRFLDLLGATNLIPGPNSTEMAIHIGHERAGFPGLLVAGACFILPATLIVLLLAWVYVTYGTLPQLAGLLYGIKPVVLAIVIQAIFQLGKTAIKSWELAIIAVVSFLLSWLWNNEIAILLGSGLLMLAYRFNWRNKGKTLLSVPMVLGMMTPTGAIGSTMGIGLLPIFLFFLKVGAVLFGSGYVLLAFLQSELVNRYGWLTQQQLLDAIVVGQVTPGPVLTTATFIGYLLAGPQGAFWATFGIFLPAFVFVGLSAPFIPRLRNSKLAAHFLDGVNASAVALMGVVTCQLFPTAVVDVSSGILLAASLIAVFCFRVNTAWLCLLGGLSGLLSHA